LSARYPKKENAKPANMSVNEMMLSQTTHSLIAAHPSVGGDGIERSPDALAKR
jgi:hypothetical protein